MQNIKISFIDILFEKKIQKNIRLKIKKNNKKQ